MKNKKNNNDNNKSKIENSNVEEANVKETVAENKTVKTKKSTKKRKFIVLIFLAVIAFVLYIIFRGSYLEKLEIGDQYVSVFLQNCYYKILSVVVTFILVFIAVYIANRRIYSGLKGFYEDEKRTMTKLPNKSISLIVATLVSLFTAEITTNKLILFLNATTFEIKDNIFNKDIGYYLFIKPFLEYLGWFGIILLVAITIYMGIYYIIALNTQFDGVRSDTLKNSKIVKQLLDNTKMLSVLIAIITFLKTEDLSANKFLTIVDKSTYSLYGAGITDITIKLWGYRILAILIVISVFMAISMYNKKKTKKVIGCISVVPVYLCLLMVTLIGYNTMFIKSNELDKQKKYINYNIENTRNAYNIDIDELLVGNNGTLDSTDINDNAELLDSVSIVNSDLVLQNLNANLTNKGYYTFVSSQIGQYNVNGKDKIVYISPREIVNKGNSYVNSTYEYTHGYGIVATSASNTSNNGNLENVQKGFNDNNIFIKEPRIYFGLQTNETIVTNSTNKEEFDYPIAEGKNEINEYNGQAGLKLNFVDRIVLSIFKGDTKLAFSSDVNENSKIITNRNVLKRVKSIMPYLTYDEKPYLVVTDSGELVWVIDGYTTSNYYPYAQKSIVNNKEINYIRNSVKVLVDAYNGDVKMYITDRTDPIVMAYRKAYPDLFMGLDEQIPEEISGHFVYSEFLYNIQANILKRYHNITPDVLYRADDVWDIATYNLAGASNNSLAQISPYYTMIKTSENSENVLGLVIPYTVSGKQNITSYLVGNYNNGSSKLKLYCFPDDSNVLGLLQLDTQIEQNEEIHKQIASLNVSGTKLTKNIVVVPVDNKLLYVEAIYQQYINEDSALPTLKKVVIASGNKVAIGDTLKSALQNLVSQNAIGIEIQNSDNVEGLIELIIKANKNLEQSTENGDWEQVGKDMKKLQSLIDKLEKVQKEEKDKKEEQSSVENSNVRTDEKKENTI